MNPEPDDAGRVSCRIRAVACPPCPVTGETHILFRYVHACTGRPVRSNGDV